MKGDSDIENDEEFDCDTCDVEEIETLFSKGCKLLIKETVLKDKNDYVLHIDATLESAPTIAIAGSRPTTSIYSFDNAQLAKLDSLTNPSNSHTVGAAFAKNDNNLLYTAHSDGINLWDLRTPKAPACHFKDNTTKEDDEKKTLTCFDVSPNNRLLAAGTDLIGGDAYIIFWDVRNSKLLGGYWEAHTDDVTQIKFNDEDADQLISGSTDGLINIYDLKETVEEEAYQDSLNTQSSVELLKWCNVGGTNGIFCSTHTFDVQFWRLDDAEPYIEFKRDVLGNAIKRKSVSYGYVAAAHATPEDFFVLVGSNYNNGECLRGLTLDDKSLKPAYNFKENSQQVRASFFNPNTNTLITGGEKGIVNIWKLDKTHNKRAKVKK